MVVKGLEDIVAAESEMSFIDGEEGTLVYRGYDIHDLAENVRFEELLPLLWEGELPDRDALADVEEQLRENRAVAQPVLDFVGELADQDIHPMSALRTAVSSLAAWDPDGIAERDEREANLRKGFRMTAQIITLIAAFQRRRSGEPVVDPDPELSHAANFLYMLNGEKPSETATEAFDVCLVLHADHGLNASTFSARVTASTLSDLHSAITTAIGTLKGPLHGGANTQVMKMLLEIDERGVDPVDYLKEQLANGEKIPGFGHRVYRTEDPRATHLREMSEQLGRQNDSLKWFEYSRQLEDYMLQEKGINCNVDFYSASTFYQMGIPIDLYTTIFASSRIAGWIGHVLEQLEDNRLIRPRAEYVGPKDRVVSPLSERG